MKKEQDLINKKEAEAEQAVETLPVDQLDQVVGASGLKDIPRVPTQPIDGELREDI